jgi:hypothetical protein
MAAKKVVVKEPTPVRLRDPQSGTIVQVGEEYGRQLSEHRRYTYVDDEEKEESYYAEDETEPTK